MWRDYESELEEEPSQSQGLNLFWPVSQPLNLLLGEKKSQIWKCVFFLVIRCIDCMDQIPQATIQLCTGLLPLFLCICSGNGRYWQQQHILPCRKFTILCDLFSFHSLSMYLLRNYYVPGIFLDMRDIPGNKRDECLFS